MNWVVLTSADCWMKSGKFLNRIKIFMLVTHSVLNVVLQMALVRSLETIFLGRSLDLPILILFRAYWKRISLAMEIRSHWCPATTRIGQIQIPFLTSLLGIFPPKAMGTFPLKSWRRVQASQIRFPSPVQQKTAFFPALVTLLLSQLGWIILSIPILIPIPCFPLNSLLRRLQLTCLVCQTSLAVLKDFLKDPCSCLKVLFHPRIIKAQGDQPLFLGTRWWICLPRHLP